ncbi:MAG TPA: hypothetical protein VNU93_07480, partial [Verrucomicrobiae bacterium]|nr:hypothetical protein [Verrucomicrobiae bacterium]
HTGVSFRVRLGTSLWLKDDCYKARTTVLDIKSISPGKTFGYKQRKALRGGYIVCVSGGSAAGIGLEGPVYAKGIKDRLKLTVFWLMNIFNLHLSPFAYAGKRLFFAEPPHMQTSLLKFPAKSQLPHIGEEISVKNLRMTIANFDRIVEVETGSTDSARDAFQERNIRQGITVEP